MLKLSSGFINFFTCHNPDIIYCDWCIIKVGTNDITYESDVTLIIICMFRKL